MISLNVNEPDRASLFHLSVEICEMMSPPFLGHTHLHPSLPQIDPFRYSSCSEVAQLFDHNLTCLANNNNKKKFDRDSPRYVIPRMLNQTRINNLYLGFGSESLS